MYLIVAFNAMIGSFELVKRYVSSSSKKNLFIERENHTFTPQRDKIKLICGSRNIPSTD